MKQEKFRDLIARLNALIQNTSFTVSKCEMSNVFGNILIELTKGSKEYRFICDRGDIFLEKKPVGNEVWSDAQLLHANDCSDTTTAIIETIKSFISAD